MPTVYIGTSELRAPLLVALGWKNLPVSTDVNVARAQARKAAVADLCVPVVLSLETRSVETSGMDVGPSELRVHEVVSNAGLSLEQQMGFEFTAGIGDVVSGLLETLDNTHKAIRNALEVGQGGQATLPSFSDLRSAGRKLVGKSGDNDDELDEKTQKAQDAAEDKAFAEKLKKDPKMANKNQAQLLLDYQKKRQAKRDAAKKKKDAERKKHIQRAQQGLKKHLNKVHKTVTKHINRLKKSAFAPKRNAVNAKPKAPSSKVRARKAATHVSTPKSNFGVKAPPKKPIAPKVPTTKPPEATVPKVTTKKAAAPKPAANTNIKGPAKNQNPQDWWDALTRQEKVQYLKDHPNSKFK
jgi:hypothetical protein